MSIFDDTTPTQSEVDSVKPSVQREVKPNEPSTPLTAHERSALDASDTSPAVDQAQPGERAATFIAPGAWVSPRLKQARQQAALLPKVATIKALEDRLFEVARHDGQPEELTKAVAEAREACQVAHRTLDEARHPELPSQTRSAEVKQAAIVAIDQARAAVDQAVQISERDDVRVEQYENIVAGVPEAQRAAAEALEVAVEAFTRWRNLVDAGHDLAVATGMFGPDWHRHKDARSVNPRGLVGDLRRARDLAKTNDPFMSGAYLVDDPTPEGELPEWTREALRVVGGDWNTSVLWRLQTQHPNDPAARETLEAKDLRIINTAVVPALHPDARAWGSDRD